MRTGSHSVSPGPGPAFDAALEDVDAVVNAAGALQDETGDDLTRRCMTPGLRRCLTPADAAA